MRFTTLTLAIALVTAPAPGCKGSPEAGESPEAPEAPATAAAAEPAEPPAAPEAGDPTLEEARALVASGDAHRAVAAAWALAEDRPRDVDVLVLLAGAYSLADRHDEALATAERALAVDPASPGARLAKGSALHGLDRTADAIALTRALLADHPDHLAALQNLAVYLEASGDARGRVEALEALRERLPEETAVLADLARAYGAAERADDALALALMLVEREPRDPAHQLLLAVLRYEAGDVLRAMDRLEIVLRLDPEREAALELFRAAFYVAASAQLRCEHGPRPWSADAVAAVLADFRDQGLGGTDLWHGYDARFGDDPEVTGRVDAAARRRCPR